MRPTVFVLWVLGPLLAIAVVGGWRLTRGPMPSRTLNGFWHLCRAYTRPWHGLRAQGVEHIPETGSLIIASNHTTGLDPLLLQSACPRVIRWVMLSGWRFRPLEPLWRAIDPVTLDQDARDVSHIREVVRRLKGGEVIGLFPEGGLEREQRTLNPFHPGIVMIAKRSDAMIVPAFIAGTPRRRHMLWHFLQPSQSRVTFGPAYRPEPTWSREQTLDDLRRRIETLQRQATSKNR